MFRNGLLVLSLGCLLIVAYHAYSQDKAARHVDKSNVQVLMRDKLSHMQGVLDGVVTEEYEKIGEHAEMLRMIGQAASWQAMDTEEYRVHSKRYARLASRLTQAAEKEDHNAVLLQYLQLNISCVDCHQYIRQNR